MSSSIESYEREKKKAETIVASFYSCCIYIYIWFWQSFRFENSAWIRLGVVLLLICPTWCYLGCPASIPLSSVVITPIIFVGNCFSLSCSRWGHWIELTTLHSRRGSVLPMELMQQLFAAAWAHSRWVHDASQANQSQWGLTQGESRSIRKEEPFPSIGLGKLEN